MARQIVTRQAAAWLMSCDKLFSTFDKVYFWTFTFVKVYPDFRYALLWKGFIQDLGRLHGGMLSGMRVVEVGDGGHGLHFHALLNQRVSVHQVRRLGRRWGIGIIHVRRADEGAGRYLAKYLTKGDCIRGVRRWGAIGGFRVVRCRDLEGRSDFHRNIRALSGGRQMGYLAVLEVYRKTILYGDRRKWPVPKLVYCPF